MRSVALDLGVKETSFCEVSRGLVVARRTVSELRNLEDLLGPGSKRATVGDAMGCPSSRRRVRPRHCVGGEAKFRGETPSHAETSGMTGASWGSFLNDENSFSDHVKRHLEEDLKERGVVLNREVEIRRSVGPGTGQRTDIHVDAVRRAGTVGYEQVKVIIEAKGCWNADVRTAMRTQLRDRYLLDSDCRHGLYLVGWFRCMQWSSRDDRQKTVPWTSLDEARVELAGQAGQLTSDVTIRSYVLNAALR